MGKHTVGASRHVPVLGEEVCYWLDSQRPMIILDCTVGYGGHAEMLLEHSDPGTKLVGLDQDPQAVVFSQERLMGFGERVVLRKGNYRDLKNAGGRS